MLISTINTYIGQKIIIDIDKKLVYYNSVYIIFLPQGDEMAKSFTSDELSKMTNEQLVLLAQEGDGSALNLLVSRMLPVAFSCASGFDDSVISREDLVQESMFGLLSAVRTYSADRSASFKTYAGVCIKNKIASVVRSSNCGNVGGNMSLGDEEVPDFSSNPEEMIIAGERRQSLSGFISRELSDFEKSVIKLYLAGNSYKEISVLLSSHPKAVDNALQRIRHKFKKLV